MSNDVLINRMEHILMLKSKFLPDVGLLEGKMGIVLAFAYLYRHTCNKTYYECMSELLDDVLEHVYKGLDVEFTSGFTGIGWGLEYLLQSGFVEGDGVEVCEEIDKKIMAFDVRRMTDMSLESGLEGLLHYVLIHIRGSKEQLPFDELYFSDLYAKVKTLVDAGQWEDSFLWLGSMYMHWYETRSMPDYPLDVLQFVDSPVVEQEQISVSPLGLRNGLAGLLLRQLLI